MDFLSEIIAAKRRRIAAAKKAIPLATLRSWAEKVRASAQSLRLSRALNDESKPNIIAEFKRRSPSKGNIKPGADAAVMSQLYESAGAAAVSVLTEEDYFAGSLDDLRAVRAAISIPILRKDFIVDEYQAYESAAAGADALLLIVAALPDEALARLRSLTEDELGMDALVEVHSRTELDRAIGCGARTIGINNRDLHTFTVSTSTSTQLARLAPADTLLISESGLNPEDVSELRGAGFKGFLIGEALMRAEDPALAVREFIEGAGELKLSQPTSATSQVKIKICGITNLADARAAIDAGADFLGFNFYSLSPRFIQPDAAAKIIQELRSSETTEQETKMIGVFVNTPVDDLLRIVSEVKLDGVQLHGDEPIEFSEQLKLARPKLLQIKAFAAKRGLNPHELIDYPADAIMLDGFDATLRGGTGRRADWRLAREAAETLPQVFLAGGLAPENVADAINAVRPFAVDACSSLEIAPGRKDAERMKRFVAAVRSVTLSEDFAAGEET